MKIEQDISFHDPESIRVVQDRLFVSHLRYLQQHSPFYKRLFSEHNLAIERMHSVDDLALFPVVSKDDFQRANFDFLCCDRSSVVEYCATSGTSGEPVTVALNSSDLDRLALNEFLSMQIAGVKPGDVVQFMLTLDRQFMAGLAYHQGLVKLGASVIRTGPGNPAMQFKTIANLKPSVIIAVPSFIVKLIDYAKEHGIELPATSVRKAICIGENIRDENLEFNALGKRILQDWNIELFSTYASTEMQTAFTECEFHCGGHQQPAMIICEVLDDSNNPVKNGEAGELTVTPLGITAMPLLRYKTGDVCRMFSEPCKCGRNSSRISPVIGRKQQMIKYNGTTYYPPALFNVLNSIPGINDYLVEVTTGSLQTDDILVYLDADAATLNSVKEKFQSQLRVVPTIKIVPLDEIMKMQLHNGSRKPVKFIDHRK